MPNERKAQFIGRFFIEAEHRYDENIVMEIQDIYHLPEIPQGQTLTILLAKRDAKDRNAPRLVDLKGNTQDLDLSRVNIRDDFACSFDKHPFVLPRMITQTFDCSGNKNTKLFQPDANIRFPVSRIINCAHAIKSLDQLKNLIKQQQTWHFGEPLTIIVQDTLIKPMALSGEANKLKTAQELYKEFQTAFNDTDAGIKIIDKDGKFNLKDSLEEIAKPQNKHQMNPTNRKPSKQKKEVKAAIKNDSDMDIKDVVKKIMSDEKSAILQQITQHKSELKKLDKFADAKNVEQILTAIVNDVFRSASNAVMKLRTPKDTQSVRTISFANDMDFYTFCYDKIWPQTDSYIIQAKSEKNTQNDGDKNNTQDKNEKKDNDKSKSTNAPQKQNKRTLWITQSVLDTLKEYHGQPFKDRIKWLQSLSNPIRKFKIQNVEGIKNGKAYELTPEKIFKGGMRLYVPSVEPEQMLAFCLGSKKTQNSTDMDNVKASASLFTAINDELKKIDGSVPRTVIHGETLYNFNAPETRKLLGIENQEDKSVPTDITRDVVKQAEQTGQQATPFQQAFSANKNDNAEKPKNRWQPVEELIQIYCEKHPDANKQEITEKVYAGCKELEDKEYLRKTDGGEYVVFDTDADGFIDLLLSGKSKEQHEPDVQQQDLDISGLNPKSAEEWAQSYLYANGKPISTTFMELILEQVLPRNKPFAESIGFKEIKENDDDKYIIADTKTFTKYLYMQSERLVPLSMAARITFINEQALIDKCDTLEPDPKYFFYTGAYYDNIKYYFVRDNLREFVATHFAPEDKIATRWSLEQLAKRLKATKDEIMSVIKANRDSELIQQCFMSDGFFVPIYFDTFKELYKKFYRDKANKKKQEREARILKAQQKEEKKYANFATQTLDEWVGTFIDSESGKPKYTKSFMYLVLETLMTDSYYRDLIETHNSKDNIRYKKHIDQNKDSVTYTIGNIRSFEKLLDKFSVRLIPISQAAQQYGVSQEDLLEKCNSLKTNVDSQYGVPYFYKTPYFQGEEMYQFYIVKQNIHQFMQKYFSENADKELWKTDKLVQYLAQYYPGITSGVVKQINKTNGVSIKHSNWFTGFGIGRRFLAEYAGQYKAEYGPIIQQMLHLDDTQVKSDADIEQPTKQPHTEHKTIKSARFIVSQLREKYDCNIDQDLFMLLVNKYNTSFQEYLEHHDGDLYEIKRQIEELSGYIKNNIPHLIGKWKTSEQAAMLYYNDQYKIPRGVNVYDLAIVLSNKCRALGVNDETKNYFAESGDTYFWNITNLPTFIKTYLPDFVRIPKESTLDNPQATSETPQQTDETNWITIEELAARLQTTPDVIRQVNNQYKVSHNHPDWTSGRQKWRFNAAKVPDYEQEYGDIIREITQLKSANNSGIPQEPAPSEQPTPVDVAIAPGPKSESGTKFDGMLGVKALTTKLDAMMKLIDQKLKEKEDTEHEIQTLDQEISEINDQAIAKIRANDIDSATELLNQTKQKKQELEEAKERVKQLDQNIAELRAQSNEASEKLRRFQQAQEKRKAAEQAVQIANEEARKANEDLQQFLENGFNLD